ncbi:MAG: helix-turn-helix transcriptional regulator [Planctomycetes bacterium]|nr:helix-turn-helix transcriptional regulator [Planctomycetota bacterium]
MNNNLTEKEKEKEIKISNPVPFVLYQYRGSRQKDECYYNEEALDIISFALDCGKKTEMSPSDITTFCLKWMKLLDKKVNGSSKNGDDPLLSAELIDIFNSHRRRYGIRGVIMSPCGAKEKQYLFLLERICNDNVNLQKAFRQWKLTPREREIIQLLIDDRCNKEIARSLKLSNNTIKVYMKLLMLKLGVTGRAGVVARLLTGK